MDNLEIRHDPATNVSEASIQLKSNCGCLLIDDFGRQRIDPAELLNRWIVPLESRHDYLTLATGKKIQVPFEQLIIFSTNLEPQDLTDEAFMRRIPYKIEVKNPSVAEFTQVVRGGLPDVFLPVPSGGRSLFAVDALHASSATAAAVPRPRFAGSDQQLLRVPRSAGGIAPRLFGPSGELVISRRRRRSRCRNPRRLIVSPAHGRVYLPCDPISKSTTNRCPATA